MTDDSWIPAAGFAAMSGASNREIAAALEIVRRSRCGYVGDPCDCKRGIAGRLVENPDHPNWHKSSEATGCYELRVAIHRLLGTGVDG